MNSFISKGNEEKIMDMPAYMKERIPKYLQKYRSPNLYFDLKAIDKRSIEPKSLKMLLKIRHLENIL